MNKKYILFLLIVLPILFISIYFFQESKKSTLSVTDSKDVNVNNSIVKTYTYLNPLNGEMYQTETEPAFLKNRPLGVMVNNALPARPQVGLESADLVYEIIAEGGITRFLAFFLSDLPETVGPIRSTREYYLTLVKEIGDAMVMHIGFSPQARQRIDDWKVRSLGLGGASFYRDSFGDSSLATEHTAFANANDLLAAGEKLGWGGSRKFDSWKFKEDRGKTSNLTSAQYLEISFWYKGDYTGIFKYNESENTYQRFSGFDNNENPILLKNRKNLKTVNVKNVIVQFAEEKPIENDDKNRLDYILIGQGEALFFLDGKVQKGTWKKESLESRTKFYLENNEEVEFNRGKIWVSVVPSRNKDLVVYK
jgi:hypothetical protein